MYAEQQKFVFVDLKKKIKQGFLTDFWNAAKR